MKENDFFLKMCQFVENCKRNAGRGIPDLMGPWTQQIGTHFFHQIKNSGVQSKNNVYYIVNKVEFQCIFI